MFNVKSKTKRLPLIYDPEICKKAAAVAIGSFAKLCFQMSNKTDRDPPSLRTSNPGNSQSR